MPPGRIVTVAFSAVFRTSPLGFLLLLRQALPKSKHLPPWVFPVSQEQSSSCTITCFSSPSRFLLIHSLLNMSVRVLFLTLRCTTTTNWMRIYCPGATATGAVSGCHHHRHISQCVSSLSTWIAGGSAGRLGLEMDAWVWLNDERGNCGKIVAPFNEDGWMDRWVVVGWRAKQVFRIIVITLGTSSVRHHHHHRHRE